MIVRPELQTRSPFAVFPISGSCVFALPINFQTKANTCPIKKLLRLVGLPRQVLNLGKAQVPSLMELRILSLFPQLIHAGANRDFDVNAFSSHDRWKDIVGIGILIVTFRLLGQSKGAAARQDVEERPFMAASRSSFISGLEFPQALKGLSLGAVLVSKEPLFRPKPSVQSLFPNS